MKAAIILAPAVALLLQGCVVRTAANVVTLPVKAVGQTADWATTSQEERDRNEGRAARKQRERDAKDAKRAEKERRQQCRKAGYSDC